VNEILFLGTTKDENVMNSLVLSVHTECPIKLEMTNVLIKYELWDISINKDHHCSDSFIIISSFYSSVEHMARVKVHHLFLFTVKAFTSAQVFFSGFNSFSTVCHHVVLGFPLSLIPCGIHSNAAVSHYNNSKYFR
jgi:hypothetical protein